MKLSEFINTIANNPEIVVSDKEIKDSIIVLLDNLSDAKYLIEIYKVVREDMILNKLDNLL